MSPRVLSFSKLEGMGQLIMVCLISLALFRNTCGMGMGMYMKECWYTFAVCVLCHCV
jgi:hypothetical protein